MMRHKLNDRSGNVAMLFACALLPLSVAIGASVDFGRQLRTDQAAQAVSDAAALMAVVDEHNTKTAAELKAAAEGYIKANSVVVPHTDVSYNVSVSIDHKTSSRTAVVSYTARVPTSFLSLVGMESLTVNGSATASSGLPPDTSFYFLIDTSDSMGLAATESARTRLISLSVANGTGKCEFACHVKRKGTQTLLAVARANDIKLRIDVAKDGILKIISLATAAAEHDGVINQYALTSMSSKISTISDLTTDVTSFKKKVANLELGYGMGSSLANTLWDKTTPNYITELKRLTAAGGDPTADRIVVLVTDGLRSQDAGNGTDSNGKPLIRPFDLDQCTAIKNAGYKLAIIYTMYYPVTYDSWYNAYVAPIRSSLETNLEACATDGLFAVGDTPEQIDSAFETIFKATRSFPRLSG